MTDFTQSPRKVLAVMDESEAQTALISAAALALRHGATLEVIACIEPPHDLGVIARLSKQMPGDLIDRLYAEKKDRVTNLLQAHLPEQQIMPKIKVGKAFIEIIKHVIATDCDFVVKQAEPLSGIHRLLFASTDQHLLRKCPCPVWMQPPGTAHRAKRIIAAVDVDLADAAEPDTLQSLNRRVLQTARMIAEPQGAHIDVVHAWDVMGEGLVWTFSSGDTSRLAADQFVNAVLAERQKAMGKLLHQAKDDDGVSSTADMIPHLIRGAPEQVIEDHSRRIGADVVVMGTVARTGISGIFIGNTAENIINSLECPVLAVKPDGFVSPLDTRSQSTASVG